MAAGFFDSVALANHNHSATPGDGGTLTEPLPVNGQPTGQGQLATTDYDLIQNLIWGL